MWSLILAIPGAIKAFNTIASLLEAAFVSIRAAIIKFERKAKSKAFNKALEAATSDKSKVKSTKRLEDMFRGKDS